MSQPTDPSKPTQDLAAQHVRDTYSRLARLKVQKREAIAGHASYERAYARSMQVLDEMIAECETTAAHWSDVNKASESASQVRERSFIKTLMDIGHSETPMTDEEVASAFKKAAHDE